ncbi:hypothetical protein V6N13_053813 [Hibiscus sabdariffa]
MDLVISRALEDIRCMGETLNPLERTKGNSYWKVCMDKQNNAEWDLGDSTAYRGIRQLKEQGILLSLGKGLVFKSRVMKVRQSVS